LLPENPDGLPFTMMEEVGELILSQPLYPSRRERHTIHYEIYEFPIYAIKSLVDVNFGASSL